MNLRHSPLGFFVNPAHIAERSLSRNITDLVTHLGLDGHGVWLDVGCGNRPYENLFKVARFIGLDVAESGRSADLKRPDVFYDGSTIPFDDETADGVLCTQVLEHVSSPDQLLHEIARCLKPGGKLVMTAPFLWEEHEIPYDFLRFSNFGLKHMLEKHGFQIAILNKTTGSIEALAQAFSIALFNHLHLPLPGFGRMLTALICAPIQIFGTLLQKALPNCRSLYLDNAVLAYKLPRQSAT